MSTSDTIEDGEVQELLKTTGTDLRQYSAQIEKEFKEVENRSIEDYIAQSQNIANLHNQIGTTSNILERMEAGLMEIQSALNNISTEITTLQKKSVSMSVQLTNRQSIRAQLSQFIEDMAVPEEMIQTIMEVPVTEKEFLTHLMELNHKLNLMKELNFKESKSSQDISEVLFKLKIKAMSKLRVYCMEQIYKFRKPMTNYQIPQNAMLKFKFFFEFILSNERGVAQDICNEYIDTMGKIYYSYFKSYSTRLAALKFEEAVSKDDLMGLEDTVTRSIFSKTSSLKNKSTVFSIGDRGDVLNQQLEAPIIVPHAQQKTRYPYESLFRSEQYALVDNACREYLFVTEFFIVRGPQAQELFNQIMGKTMTMLIVSCCLTWNEEFPFYKLLYLPEKPRNLRPGLLRHDCPLSLHPTLSTLSTDVPQTVRSGVGQVLGQPPGGHLASLRAGLPYEHPKHPGVRSDQIPQRNWTALRELIR